MSTIADLITDIVNLDQSSRTGLDVNWPRVVRAMQGILAHYQSTDRAGTLPNDIITSLQLGDLSVGQKRVRLFYDPADTTLKFQKNTGSQSVPVWTNVATLSDAGAFSVTGAISYVGYVSHIAQHLPTGSDPIPTAAGVDVTTANGVGTANTFSRSDHAHRGVRSVDVESSGSPLFGDINVLDDGRIAVSKGAGTVTVGFTSPNRLYQTTVANGDQAGITSTGSPPTAILGMSGIAIPGANGVRKYRISAYVPFTNTGAATHAAVSVHVGAAGSSADTVVFRAWTFSTNAGGLVMGIAIPAIDVVPATGSKVTLSFFSVAGSSHTVKALTFEFSTILIEEVL